MYYILSYFNFPHENITNINSDTLRYLRV